MNIRRLTEKFRSPVTGVWQDPFHSNGQIVQSTVCSLSSNWEVKIVLSEPFPMKNQGYIPLGNTMPICPVAEVGVFEWSPE